MTESDSAACIVLAFDQFPLGGQGPPNQLRRLADRPLLAWSLATCDRCDDVDSVVIVLPAELCAEVRGGVLEKLATHKAVRVIAAGHRRRDSVVAGLHSLPGNAHWVVVHEASRPLASPELFSKVIDAARASGAATASLSQIDSLRWRRSPAGGSDPALPSDRVVTLQTPQAFSADLLRQAYDRAPAGLDVFDDAALLSALGHDVALVTGERDNLKITEAGDFPILERLAEGRSDRRKVPAACRTGFAQEAYHFVPGRPLLLAGVHVPHSQGLEGYSDADLVCHATSSALLGAAGLGDLEDHFPRHDPRWHRIGGTDLVARTAATIGAAGYLIENVDALVVWDPGRLAPHRRAMRKSLTSALGVGPGRVSIKTSKGDNVAFQGRDDGVMAQVVVTLRSVGTWSSDIRFS